jgi:hypothetical protein
MEWQPTIKGENEPELKLITDYGFGGATRTYVHASEGDTIYIRQTGVLTNVATQHISLTHAEFKDIIFNFMSEEELIDIAKTKVADRVIKEIKKEKLNK